MAELAQPAGQPSVHGSATHRGQGRSNHLAVEGMRQPRRLAAARTSGLGDAHRDQRRKRSWLGAVQQPQLERLTDGQQLDERRLRVRQPAQALAHELGQPKPAAPGARPSPHTVTFNQRSGRLSVEDELAQEQRIASGELPEPPSTVRIDRTGEDV